MDYRRAQKISSLSEDGIKFTYRILFSRTFDPIALYRVAGNVCGQISAERIFFVDINPAYERVMKVRREDVIGRSYHDIWPACEPQWPEIILKCLRCGHMVHTERESLEAESYLEAMAFPLPPDMAAVIFLDKTLLKESNDALRRKQKELRILAMQMTLVEEDTRRAIATDLHDRIGYDLVSQLQKIRALKDRVPEEFRTEISALENNTEQLISGSRSLIFELSPPILKEVGLNPGLESLAENLLAPRGIKWEMRSRGSIEDFWADDGICVILYRMARELLINVIKHSEATSVTLIVNRGAGKIMVAVEDNGKGFPPGFDIDSEQQRRSARSFGLFSIKARLEPIGGEIKIISEPGRGATVAMSCPLKMEEGAFK